MVGRVGDWLMSISPCSENEGTEVKWMMMMHLSCSASKVNKSFYIFIYI